MSFDDTRRMHLLLAQAAFHTYDDDAKFDEAQDTKFRPPDTKFQPPR